MQQADISEFRIENKDKNDIKNLFNFNQILDLDSFISKNIYNIYHLYLKNVILDYKIVLSTLEICVILYQLITICLPSYKK